MKVPDRYGLAFLGELDRGVCETERRLMPVETAEVINGECPFCLAQMLTEESEDSVRYFCPNGCPTEFEVARNGADRADGAGQ